MYINKGPSLLASAQGSQSARQLHLTLKKSYKGAVCNRCSLASCLAFQGCVDVNKDHSITSYTALSCNTSYLNAVDAKYTSKNAKLAKYHATKGVYRWTDACILTQSRYIATKSESRFRWSLTPMCNPVPNIVGHGEIGQVALILGQLANCSFSIKSMMIQHQHISTSQQILLSSSSSAIFHSPLPKVSSSENTTAHMKTPRASLTP